MVHSALQVQNQTEEHEIESAMYTQVYMHYGRQEGFFLGGGGVFGLGIALLYGDFSFLVFEKIPGFYS